ncbi:S1 family peptidase [Thalassococcus lentus]|uniref:Serine protease n=1 Tax=Thalassococcus lentus TaxID=1210524 RepID=A0ABT4XW92_9RHOB|nr:serine protease [Thalassococcus lentus]MDA7426217.1 serine protease [Thalassococcus lentus]
MSDWIWSRLKLFVVIVSLALQFPSLAQAQEYEHLFRDFEASQLTRNEKRYLQAALAFEGHYVGLLDGDWGKLSREAISRFSLKEFGAQAEEWHMAVLAFKFFEKYDKAGWDSRYFPVADISVMLPLKELQRDPPSENFVNFRHVNSSLAVSIGVLTQSVANNVHQFTQDSHSNSKRPYSVRKDNFAVTVATLRDGTVLYTRSNFLNGLWSTVMVSARRQDKNLLSAVTSSISIGREQSFGLHEDGKLWAVIQDIFAFLESREESELGRSAALSETKRQRAASYGSGLIVSDAGHVLTNAHVIDGCKSISVDGNAAFLIDRTNDADLALLKTQMPNGKAAAVFAAEPAKLNSDVTAVGFPYAGILGGLNVTRGSVSSLKGLLGDATRMQITAPVQSGNSGGPLVASDGEVVGVVVSKLDANVVEEVTGDIPQNINFAVRGEIAKLFLSQNQVDPKLSFADDAIAPEELANKVSRFTVFVECK